MCCWLFAFNKLMHCTKARGPLHLIFFSSSWVLFFWVQFVLVP